MRNDLSLRLNNKGNKGPLQDIQKLPMNKEAGGIETANYFTFFLRYFTTHRESKKACTNHMRAISSLYSIYPFTKTVPCQNETQLINWTCRRDTFSSFQIIRALNFKRQSQIQPRYNCEIGNLKYVQNIGWELTYS
jgi:hypothetical protein